MTRPFELTESDLHVRMDEMVGATFADLTSQFMLLPSGSNYLPYEDFAAGYEALRLATNNFADFTPDTCWAALRANATALVVIRTMLGISPPEWQDVASEASSAPTMPSNWARGIDGKARSQPTFFGSGSGMSGVNRPRVQALLDSACRLLAEGALDAPEGLIHRLDKIDTAEGLESLRFVATHDVPYSVLLYERYLGRPFASHRDSVSELVGDVMESAIEEALATAGIPFRKTRRAERVAGFDQAPDFFVPNELVPAVIIEAKITGDDGTARDKVSRILRLANMRDERIRAGKRTFQVVACIDGRGFGVRRQDMEDMLRATKGKVFTANTLADLVRCTDLALFVPPSQPKHGPSAP